MIDSFSFVIPCEKNRYDMFVRTYQQYKSFGFPKDMRYEFLLISRTLDPIILPDIRVIKYHFEGENFNPAKAFNIGVNHSIYENIIITSPEILPVSNVLGQFRLLERGNYICQVFDQMEDGTIKDILVNSTYRSQTPAMYFLALFKKEDLIFINGWDESFMQGFAWEDIDFGERFSRAGLKFRALDNVQAIHMYHPRNYMVSGWNVNATILEINNRNQVVTCKNGLKFIE